MQRYGLLALVVSLLLTTLSCYATNLALTINGTESGYVPLTASTRQHILFDKVQMTPEAKQALATRIHQSKRMLSALPPTLTLPTQVLLNLSLIPVLNQSPFGTCAVFASTVAIDYASRRGNLISQLCLLELSDYLHKQQNPRIPDGWHGSNTQIILYLMKNYGIIPTYYQTSTGCAGVFQYPTSLTDMGHPMSDVEYTSNSIKLMAHMGWKPVIVNGETLTLKENLTDPLINVKQALANHHVIVYSLFLDNKFGWGGALGKFHRDHDSFIITPEIQSDSDHDLIYLKHDLIVIGYDDNAVITGPNNSQHTGVLTLRNSWGSGAGDHGNYYMSYEYFLAMGLDAQEVLPYVP